MVPSSDLLMMTSCEDSTIAASRACASMASHPVGDVTEDQHRARRWSPPRHEWARRCRRSAARRRPARSARCGSPAPRFALRAGRAAPDSRPAGGVLVIDDVEDLGQGRPDRLVRASSRSRSRRHAFRKVMHALGVGADDGVADAGQRDAESLATAPRSAHRSDCASSAVLSSSA